ncbi:unnamed protein product [Boreogadus saida]
MSIISLNTASTVSPPITERLTDHTTASLSHSPPGGSVVVSGTTTNRSIKLVVFTTSTVMYETKTGTPLNGQSISSKRMTATTPGRVPIGR